MLSPLLLHKSGIIYLLLLESHHHLIPSNVISKLTTLPHHSTHHLATPPHLRFNFFNFGALTNFLHYIHYITCLSTWPIHLHVHCCITINILAFIYFLQDILVCHFIHPAYLLHSSFRTDNLKFFETTRYQIYSHHLNYNIILTQHELAIVWNTDSLLVFKLCYCLPGCKLCLSSTKHDHTN